MSLNRYNTKRDKNEKQIIQTLTAFGLSVFSLDVPVDLLLCFRGVTFLAEVKDGPKATFTPSQIKFLRDWGGDVFVLNSNEAALELVKQLRRGDASEALLESKRIIAAAISRHDRLAIKRGQR